MSSDVSDSITLVDGMTSDDVFETALYTANRDMLAKECARRLQDRGIGTIGFRTGRNQPVVWASPISGDDSNEILGQKAAMALLRYFHKPFSHAWLVALMGRVVEVVSVLKRDNKGKQYFWSKVPTEPTAGWVVGARWLQTGVYVPAIGGPFDEVCDPAYLHETAKRTPALCVAFWPTKKPVFVPVDGFRFNSNAEPVSPAQKVVWSEQDRKIYSEMAKEAPRDRYGRFVKVTSVRAWRNR